jgi:hypothetical protein
LVRVPRAGSTRHFGRDRFVTSNDSFRFIEAWLHWSDGH